MEKIFGSFGQAYYKLSLVLKFNKFNKTNIKFLWYKNPKTFKQIKKTLIKVL